MAKLQCGEGRMTIDLVVWTQYINVTDTQTNRHTDSQVAIALRRAAKITTDTAVHFNQKRTSQTTRVFAVL